MIVRYRVYCVIFCRPPTSFASLLSLGTTAVSSCTMIEALMYGMIPSAKIEQAATTPPLKALMSVVSAFPVLASAVSRYPCTTDGSTPGRVMAAPIRTTASMAIVKRTR